MKKNVRVNKIKAHWAYEVREAAKANNAEAKLDKGKYSISLNLKSDCSFIQFSKEKTLS